MALVYCRFSSPRVGGLCEDQLPIRVEGGQQGGLVFEQRVEQRCHTQAVGREHSINVSRKDDGVSLGQTTNSRPRAGRHHLIGRLAFEDL